jgi:hypothetical protein
MWPQDSVEKYHSEATASVIRATGGNLRLFERLLTQKQTLIQPR